MTEDGIAHGLGGFGRDRVGAGRIVEDLAGAAQRIVGRVDARGRAGGVDEPHRQDARRPRPRGEVHRVVVASGLEDRRVGPAIRTRRHHLGPAADPAGSSSAVIAHGRHPGGEKCHARIQSGGNDRLCAALAAAVNDHGAAIPFRLGGQTVQRTDQPEKHAAEIDRLAGLASPPAIIRQGALGEVGVILDGLAVGDAVRVDVQRKKPLLRPAGRPGEAGAPHARAVDGEHDRQTPRSGVSRPRQVARHWRANAVGLQIPAIDPRTRRRHGREPGADRHGGQLAFLPGPEGVEIVGHGQAGADFERADRRSADSRQGPAGRGVPGRAALEEARFIEPAGHGPITVRQAQSALGDGRHAVLRDRPFHLGFIDWLLTVHQPHLEDDRIALPVDRIGALGADSQGIVGGWARRLRARRRKGRHRPAGQSPSNRCGGQ